MSRASRAIKKTSKKVRSSADKEVLLLSFLALTVHTGHEGNFRITSFASLLVK